MRIALFSGNYNYLREGANQALNVLVRHLEKKAGHEVRIYSPVTDRPAFEPEGTLIPVRSVRLPIRDEFQLALGLPRQTRRDVAAFAPDLVHVSTPDILGTRAQTFAKRLGVPIVASQHTLFETYPAYYGATWLTPLVEAHLRRFYRRSDHVLAPTPMLVAAMKHMRGDGHASLWSRGIDRTLFSHRKRDLDWRRAQGIADDETAILFFGRLVLEKGVATYVEIVRALQDRGIRLRPLLVGAGPALEAFGALSGVVATGHLRDAALARAVASADIMLTPSITETFGNVVLEAMASGLPVVSADAPSARGLIDHGRTGFLCSPTDVDAYVKAVETLAISPTLARTIGAAGREASSAFSWDDASAAVERAYRQVVERFDRSHVASARRTADASA
jgi:glycosyltransferase involved in cell wall biosynthesis